MVVKCNPLMRYTSDRLVVNANSVPGGHTKCAVKQSFCLTLSLPLCHVFVMEDDFNEMFSDHDYIHHPGRKMSAITSESGLEDAHSKSFWVMIRCTFEVPGLGRLTKTS
ncbi:unnamed protein product [Boreogadus saida]